LCAALLVTGAAAVVSLVFAEEAKPAPGLNVDEIKKALGLSIYLQGSYNYNFNSPDSGLNDQSVFDQKANSFMLDLAQIVFQKDPAIGGLGFKLKLSAGKTAKYIHSRCLGANNTDLPFDVTEAFVSYTAPLGRGIQVDFGKFATYMGAEVIEARDNPNYSRSFLFNYAVPFTHTGLKIGYNFTDTLNAAFHVVNGWDNSSDYNKGNSYGATIGYAPAEAFSTIIKVMTGPEQANNNSNNRSLVDLIAAIKPIKPLSIIVNADLGYEEKALNNVNANWHGISTIVKYDITDMHTIATRGEYFNDRQCTGTEGRDVDLGNQAAQKPDPAA
jgi:hypothetical protein